MNPMYIKIAASLLRQALKAGGLTGVLVSENELIQFISALVAVVGFLLGLWKDYKEQQKLVTALSTARPSTERQIENLIKAGDAPSVMTKKTEVPFVHPG